MKPCLKNGLEPPDRCILQVDRVINVVKGFSRSGNEVTIAATPPADAR